MATARKYDLYSDRFRAETYSIFEAMRDNDPVLCQPGIDGETPIWFVTRYDDVATVLLDDKRFVRSVARALGGGAGAILERGSCVAPLHR